ncbi:ethanolamine ammonia-lyase subunit EutC [Lentilactobacillus farraginis]|uniref:Ethanolamine ammonia-lyase small subunit n=1 Tax=Lentilactobacillus farraginis DSM 18382 = JCM 14108 TaxID=1423743 RepID=X0PBY7_9LACO|nr:ethanolamine ammonia-lyase subunit EutC [Lentilactobacillus farraginis]KRM06649.1 ethanolamine ammonia-lyase small subunit [Lentilactobacillus farraginis DSM 18382 = JCM 14108]GAF37859.1 ethanolamine ammonia-lyase light chain [Lentilactobacillus farraginis DSM 18382 = JCM 14108]
MTIIKTKINLLTPPQVQPLPINAEGEIADIRSVNLKQQLLQDHPANPAAYRSLKAATPARLGMGRAGLRYKTRSILRLRADHAAAQDSVWSDVPTDFIKAMNFLPLQSQCQDETEYLTRPDHGRRLADNSIKTVVQSISKVPVLLAVGDGLSSEAITANVGDVIPAIKQGLKLHDISIDTIPFIRFSRVAVEDHLGDLTKVGVVCLLIGERPGLATAKSMSAYIAYRPTTGMPEARRTVISNIHPGGIPAVEAGAYIAQTICQMLRLKKSGLDLKLALKN